MKVFFAIFFLIITIAGRAQSVVDVSKEDVNASSFLHVVGGEPAGLPKFVRLKEGTPFFTDRWLKSTIILNNGATYKNVPAKIDLMDNAIHFLDIKGAEMITTSHIKEIILSNDAQDSLYRFINGAAISDAAKKGWYLWLLSGKASLYLVFNKEIIEEKPYGSATTEQRIQTKKAYVIVYNNALFGFTKIKQLPEILANKKQELETYLQKQPKNSSEENRIVDLVSYYNSLLN